jgi:hypothetical protein
MTELAAITAIGTPRIASRSGFCPDGGHPRHCRGTAKFDRKPPFP